MQNKKIALKIFLFLGLVVFISGCAQKMSHSKHKQAVPNSCKKSSIIPSIRCATTTSAHFDKKGTLWIAWYASGHVYVSRSSDKGQTFKPPISVNRTPELVYAKGENRPKLAFGNKGEIYVLWTKNLTEKRFSGHIRFSRSIDGGKHFSVPVTVNDHLEITSHRFDSIAVNKKGDIYIVWLDKRDLLAAKKVGKKI